MKCKKLYNSKALELKDCKTKGYAVVWWSTHWFAAPEVHGLNPALGIIFSALQKYITNWEEFNGNLRILPLHPRYRVDDDNNQLRSDRMIGWMCGQISACMRSQTVRKTKRERL